MYKKLQHLFDEIHKRNDNLSSPEDTYGDNDNTSGNNSIFNDLPDNYLCYGSPDKMMHEELKELNIDDIRNFLKEEEQPDSKNFEEEKRATPP